MIKGYLLQEKLHYDDRFDVYRGLCIKNNKKVILKITRQKHPSEKEIALLQHEYQILKQIEHIKGVIHVVDFIEGDITALILEDVAGESLQTYFDNQPIDLDNFFTVALALNQIVGELHENNIIYKNFRPVSIYIKDNILKLVDFSLSAQLVEESQEYQSDKEYQELSAYTAPEQTGRINRPIDYRTDFYSMGVVFFELLTGRRPFQSQDQLQLIHLILAKPAPLVSQYNSAVPAPIDAIITKLLSKMSEERYISSAGLRADLLECQRQWHENKKIDLFTIGEKDMHDRLFISDRLYGRKKQVADLYSAFMRVSQGASEIVLISGYSGVGKTSVVKEVQKPIIEKKGYYIQGKFDQMQSSIPFSAIVTAFQGLVTQLLAESENNLDKIRRLLLKALNNMGQIVIDVIPEVELIIGRQPSAPPLNSAEAQHRFNFVFLKFVQVFAQADHPIVIFLDDLQWADIASLKLIENVLSDKETHYILIIGAYRSNEVDSSHPLKVTLRTLKKINVAVSNIALKPLLLKDIQDLLSDTLAATEDDVSGLATPLHQKTQGNPFFLNIFLKMLYQEGLLFFSHQDSQWEWNIKKIMQQTVTDNVIDLLTAKINQLSPDTQEILKLAACFGHRFTLKQLVLVSQQPAMKIGQQLLEAIKYNLIINLDEIYKTTTVVALVESDVTLDKLELHYRFAHDRIQQAAYELIPYTKRNDLHLRIGRLLLKEKILTEQDERLFEIMEHFNYSLSLISSPEEKHQLAQYNLWAGEKAKASTAYQAAKEYLQAGANLLNEDDWKDNYNLTFNIYKNLAACKYLTGDFEEAEKHFQTLINNAKNTLDKIEIYRLNCEMLSTLNAHGEALTLGLRALNMLGIKIPRKAKTLHVLKTILKIKIKIGRRRVQDIDLLPIHNPEQKATVDLITQLLNNAFIIDQNLFVLLSCTNIYLSLNYGYTDSNAMSFPVYAFVIMHSLNMYQAGIDFVEFSNKLKEKYGTSTFEGKNQFILGAFIDPWRIDVNACPEILSRAFQLSYNTGDLVYAHYCNLLLVNTSFLAGKSLSETIGYLQDTNSFVAKAKISDFRGVVSFWNYLMPCLEQKSEFKQSTVLEYEMRILAGGSKTELCFFYSYLTKIFFLYGDMANALKYGHHYWKNSQYGQGMVSNVEFIFYYALAMTTCYKQADPWERFKFSRALKKALRQIKRWASWCDINFGAYLSLLEAELAANNKDTNKAILLYDQTIKTAQKNNALFLAAIASECTGRFYISLKTHKLAAFYFAEAYSMYKEFGALEKCKILVETYPECFSISKDETPEMPPAINQPMSLDMLAILKSTEIITSEIRLDRLRKKLLLVILEVTGAQRGIILVKKSNKWLIEADGNIEEQLIYLSKEEPVTSQKLPLSLLNYVQRTMQPIIIQEATQSQITMIDPYIQNDKPRSLLMLPILYQGQLTRMLYLENKSSSHVFTTQNLQSLQLIASSAMISLENARLYHQASHDSLTGLANRNLLEQIFKVSASQATRMNKQIVLFFLDLDNFKTINDTLGHEIGDRLLVYVTEKISEGLREGDIAARLGGDEFAIMLVGIEDVRQITVIADRLFRSITEPVQLLGHQVQITSSMGICLYPKDAKDVKSLIKLADIALYQAKEQGKNRYHFYSESLQEQYREIHRMESELQHALENHEFRIYYQPIIDIMNNKVVSFEALLRWDHPKKGLLEAKHFIDVLEKKALIIPVSEWLIYKICQQAKLWQMSNLLKVPIAVNTSVIQFHRQSLSKFIAATLNKFDLDAHYLELELTESTFIETNTRVFEEIDALLRLGIKLVIDDFGAGYSSLGYLKRLPVSKIKIDQSFFKKSSDNDFDLIIVAAITALAHELKLEVIAEGIENEAQLKIARDLNIDAIQGYYFSYPLSTAECEEFLKKTA
ncbi:MAG: EAL domain-containing protein [Gammaproteobacteria bacterium]|nr:EAL domain-containing protein [Gammaproteobacteria bacterium]